MKVHNFVSVDVILAKLRRDLHRDDLKPTDIIEWVAEALEGIGVVTQYVSAIRFAEVKNYRCKKPEYLKSIIQIARNNQYGTAIITPTDTVVPDEGVIIDINGTPMQAYEIAYYRPYFDLIGEFTVGGALHSQMKSAFTPVRLAQHTFFDTLVCKETDWEEIYKTCEDEYTIVDDTLKFSFPEGQVAIGYLRIQLDDSGYPMIPDTYASITAVTKYVVMKLSEIDFYNHRQGSEARLGKSESDWQWYCQQASNELKMPHGIDEWEALLRQRNYLLPRTDRYENFFGNLSHEENRNFLHNG